jgi:hypothetical protein
LNKIKSILSFYRICIFLQKFFFSHLFKSIPSSLSSLEQLFIPNFNFNQTWKQYGTNKGGGHGKGNGLNQLSNPCGAFIHDDQAIYIADYDNHRIVEWKSDAYNGQIVAGGNGQGNRNNQLTFPTKVIVHKKNDSLINRVVSM